MAEELPLSQGAQIASYRLHSRLGGGASAEVWRAEDLRLKREVALKIFRPAFVNRTSLFEFALSEARVACSISSDHVVGIHRVEQGQPYSFIDMELCAEYGNDGILSVGRSLQGIQPPSIREAVRLARDVARGLDAAHAQGVFHRDVKPENVLLRPVTRRAQLTDFGLTPQVLDGRPSDPKSQDKLTVAHRDDVTGFVVIGTPAFMAPEQASLKKTLDPHNPSDASQLRAMDVHGLGATLFAMIYGRAPRRSLRTGQSVASVMDQLRRREPIVFPLVSQLAKEPFVPAQVRRVLEKALHVEPASRHENVKALERDLTRILERRPTSCDRNRFLLGGYLWCRRNPSTVATVAAVTLIPALASPVIMDAGERTERALRKQEAAETQSKKGRGGGARS